jgi:hypothetical protein
MAGENVGRYPSAWNHCWRGGSLKAQARAAFNYLQSQLRWPDCATV